ncbi:MAG: hypothetical protein E7074_06655 [Bacteroidales bacterium]|nr:hypothetical protein [Bacteroidales bacterium]
MAKVNYFLQQYQKMSRRDCRTFKEDCMAHFSWSEQTFYNKINFGHLRPNEDRDLMKILAKYIPS